ncbi:tyrosine-type recombinase/integrase [Bradyrhizobium sp. AUGA SZCCT0176]|uniref:tyrosine-type recombinase/integrase n=1 Tax=Bradyrhizobium sp. AUGA SZCCT0176 TaxID=2807664 RepID=UPI001BAD00FB|nr:tyrosine-type recombinase/integrase [Bradyrhizobium sp. AUGA SZCCT0176]MBR1226131.1 tyrosine-type recombinase/integrase [Bradyrhizobium sp. AUGA SZCCT0176]
MARSQRHSKLDSRTARLKLAVRRKPYNGLALARGVLLLYRRNKGNGSWVLKRATGKTGKSNTSGYWTNAFAEADDFDASNGTKIMTFFEAQNEAKKLAGRTDDASGDTAPITLDGALTSYRADLIARDANPYNAEHPRVHLTSVLLSKPVQLLTSAELKKWRDSLLDTMAKSTINRLCGCVCAALELAAQHDKRIQNREAWETGLAALPNTQVARNVILSDDTVRAFVSVAYGLDEKFGLFTDTMAVTGARPSQLSRLCVEDLRDHPVRPKVMMPKSGKGGARNRAEKKLERYSVPITVELAARLKLAAKGRAGHAPLLLQSDGRPWGDNPGQSYHRMVDKIVTAIGCDPDATMYALRHSSIVRMLTASVPIRLVAALHNTSVKMIEKHYSLHITSSMASL